MSPREDGAAVVLAIGFIALLTCVALVGGGAASIVATHRRVQAAADLAALAGAAAADTGAPCAVATRIGRRNGATVTACEVADDVVTVVVERHLPDVLGGRVLRARARAGPT